MRVFSGLLIVCLVFLPRVAHADFEKDVLIGAGLLVGVPAVGRFLSNHNEELSRARDDKHALLECGILSEGYTGACLAGVFLGKDHLIFARASRKETDNVRYRDVQLGYRAYHGVLFGELGGFLARDGSHRFYLDENREIRFYDTYETRGMIGTLGASAHLWHLSLGTRVTLYRGLSTRASTDYGNGPEVSQETRGEKVFKWTAEVDFWQASGFCRT